MHFLLCGTVQPSTNPMKRATSTFTAFPRGPSRGRYTEVDVDYRYREVSQSLLNWSTSCCLNQVDGDGELIEGDLITIFVNNFTGRHCSTIFSIFTGHIHSIHCMLPARPRCAECAVIATPAPRHRRYTLYGGSGGQRAGPWGVRLQRYRCRYSRFPCSTWP